MRHDASRVACRSIAWLVIVALLASSCATKPFKPEAEELALWAYGDLYRLQSQRSRDTADRANKARKALERYERSAELDPTYPDPFRQLGLLYYQQKVSA
jgi:tetratricopeptide (TPR) repeat protein